MGEFIEPAFPQPLRGPELQGAALRPPAKSQLGASWPSFAFFLLFSNFFCTRSCGSDCPSLVSVGPAAPPGGQGSKLCPRPRTPPPAASVRRQRRGFEQEVSPVFSSPGYQPPLRTFVLVCFPHLFCSLKTIVYNIHIIYIREKEESVSECIIFIYQNLVAFIFISSSPFLLFGGHPTVPRGILAERLPFPASLLSYTAPW